MTTLNNAATMTEEQMTLEGFSVHLNFSGLYYVCEPDNLDVPLAAFRYFKTREAAMNYCRCKIAGDIE